MQGKAFACAIAAETPCIVWRRGVPPDGGMRSVSYYSGDREAKIGEGTNGEVVEARSNMKCAR